jgi:hypothetical protein
MGKIIAKTASDQTLILGTREGLLYPFTAPNWTELVLSFWWSLTKAAVDDDTTSLSESLTYSTMRDRIWWGFKTNNSNFPTSSGVVFAGSSTVSGASEAIVANGNYWETSGVNQGLLANSFDGVSSSGTASGGQRPDAPAVAASFPSPYTNNYAVAWVIALTRPNSSSNVVTAKQYKPSVQQTYNGIPNPSALPTVANLRALTIGVRASVTPVSETSPLTLSALPNAVFIYWPYSNSRLRIHAMVLEKYAP